MVVGIQFSKLEYRAVQYSTVLYGRVHESWCSVFQSFKIAHFNTTVSTFYDWCWWTRMSPCAWQVSFPHCLSVVQITLSSVMLSFIKWGCVLLFCSWCFIHSWKQIDFVHWRWIAVLSETEETGCSVSCPIPVYWLCRQSTACLNPWAVTCTCFVRQHFPAHALFDSIFSYMRFRNVIILSAEWC